MSEGSLDDLDYTVLQEINHIFKSENLTCADVGLPEPDNNLKIKIN